MVDSDELQQIPLTGGAPTVVADGMTIGVAPDYAFLAEKLGFADGYGVELGLLIDVAQHVGADRLAQVDLGERIHRNRPLHELRPQAVDVLRAALERVSPSTLPRPS